MDAYTLIKRKRDGGELTEAELAFLIQGYLDGDIPDYQMAAWCMAVFFRGLTDRELLALTRIMLASGEQLDLSAIPGRKVDKHSTGGVGDKTTLVLAPLVAAAGAPVVKLSGRGLGHTGGTIDKLEAIPGFSTALTPPQIIGQVQRLGLALAGHTANLVPADKKLYALRDVTATVESLPLIASSIMSKKLAGGCDALVLDVKVGDGAFMKDLPAARALAQAMLTLGRGLGKDVVAVLSNMDQPLGLAVGNALEVAEAVATLQNAGPTDLRELCLVLGAEMLVLAGIEAIPAAARARLEKLLANGAALEKFAALIQAQGGNPAIITQPTLLPRAPVTLPLCAPRPGFLASVATETLGAVARDLGAGRRRLGETIDPAVGLVLAHKIGDYVEAGEPVLIIHAATPAQAEATKAALATAFTLSDTPPVPPPLILEILR